MDPLCKSQIYANTKQIIVTWTDGSANPDIFLDESRVHLPKREKYGALLHNMINIHNAMDYRE